jgi:hypothetical protein
VLPLLPAAGYIPVKVSGTVVVNHTPLLIKPFKEAEMENRVRSSIALSAMLLMVCGGAIATEQPQENREKQQQVYGRELMTEEEHAVHHDRMRAAKTDAERQQIRKQNHELMKARAEQQGLSIPEEPPSRTGKKGDHKKHGGGKPD